MTEPFGAKVFGADGRVATMDPSEILDFTFKYRDPDRPTLVVGETIQTIVSLVATSDAAALGLTIGTGAKAPTIINAGDDVLFWASIAPAKQSDPAFDGKGTRLGVEITVKTTDDRTYQETGLIEVAQK